MPPDQLRADNRIFSRGNLGLGKNGKTGAFVILSVIRGAYFFSCTVKVNYYRSEF